MEEKDMKVEPETENANNEIGDSVIENVSDDIELPPNSDKPAHHHHHHHHHRRSHHKHRRSSSSKKSGKKSEKIKSFFKNNKKKLINIVVAIALVISLIFIAIIMDNNGDNKILPTDNTSSEINEPLINAIQIELPLYTDNVNISGIGVVKYMESDISVGCDEIYLQLKNTYGRLDVRAPVPISYKIIGMPADCDVEKTLIYVADNERYENAYVYEPLDGETVVYADFLYANTTYYFKISLTLSNKTKTSVEGSFKTADTPRVLLVDGVYNMRDIGGWKTLDGKSINQGLLYRGTELDGAVESKYTITQNGIKTMLNTLGIRFDMDLRSSDVNVADTDILGKSVIHKYYSEKGATQYSNIFKGSVDTKNAVRDMFKDFANPSNYPMYIHCTYGTDRTGTICYLLEALLGMSEEDLMRDYQLSALHHGVVNEQVYTFINDFKALEGDTMQEKAEGYLLSIGVTQEEIESIKTIFLE